MGTQGCFCEDHFLTQSTESKLDSPKGGVRLGRPK